MIYKNCIFSIINSILFNYFIQILEVKSKVEKESNIKYSNDKYLMTET